jgi:hypothetical protein
MHLRAYVPNGTYYSYKSTYNNSSSQYVDQPLTAMLTSSNASVIQAPATVTIPAGNYDGVSVSIQAVGGGSATVTASASGWDSATSPAISTINPWLRADVTVGTGCRSTGTIGLTGSTAPSGGFTVNLTSSDPTIVSVPATVTIPQGSNYKSFNIIGHSPGTATITMTIGSYTATNTVTVVQSGFAWDSTPPSQMTLGTSKTLYVYTNVPNGSYYEYNYASKSSNTRQVVDQALTVILSSSDASVIQMPAAVMIGAGGSYQSFNIQAVGSGSSTATAGANGWNSLTSNAVTAVGPWLRADVTVGAGCRTTGEVGLTGGTAPTGGYTVNLTSSDPTIATVPATATITQGNSYYDFTIVGHNPGTATITMTVGGFTVTNTVTVVTPQFQFYNMPAGMNIGGSGSFSIRTYVPGGTRYQYVSLNSYTNQIVDQTLTMSLTSDNPSVIQIPVTATIAAGGYSASSVSIQAVGGGSATIAVEAPGWNRTVSSTILTGDWMKADVTVGAGCRTTGTVGMATGSAPSGGYTVTLTSSDPTIVRVPTTVTIPQWNSYTNFNIAGQNPGTATITMTSGGYTTTNIVTVIKPTFEWDSYSETQFSVGASKNTYLQIYVPNGTYYSYTYKYDNTYQAVDQTTILTLTSSDPSIIQVPATVTIETGNSYNDLDILGIGLGSSTIMASAPGWDSVTSPTITVVAPLLNANVTVGAGCQADGSVNLTGYAPVGGSTFTLTSSDPTIASVPATVTIPQGSNYRSFNIVGHNPGIATITATLGGVSVTSTITVAEPKTFNLNYVPAHISVGSSATVYVYTYVPVINGSQSVAEDLTVTISSGDSSIIQAPATVTIPAGNNYTSFTILAVGEGSSALTASAPGWDNRVSGTINTAPNPWLNADVTVGTGCKTNGIVGMGDTSAPIGGYMVMLTSSDTAIASVPATVTIPEGAFIAAFSIIGHNPGTATITLSAGEVSVTSTVTVVKPTFLWSSVPTETYAGVNSRVYLYTYVPDGTYYSYNSSYGYRYADTSQTVDQPLTIILVNSNPAAIGLPGETVTITNGDYTYFQVNALAVGTTNITASALDWDSVTSGTITVVEGTPPPPPMY